MADAVVKEGVGTIGRRLARGLGTMSLANAGGALIAFASTPLLALWFSPAAFGRLGVVLAISGLVATVATLKLEVLIYPAAPAVRRDTAAIILATGVVVTSLLALPFLIWAAFGEGRCVPIAIGYILTLALIAANVGSALLIAERRYGSAAVPRLAAPILFLALAAIAHRWFDADGDALIAANALASAVASVAYVAAIRPVTLGGLATRARAFVHERRRFVRFAAPQALIAYAAFLNAALLLVSWLYGPAAAGTLFMAFRIVGFPATIMGVAAANLISAEVSRESDTALMRPLAVAMTGLGGLVYGSILTAALSVPPYWLPEQWQAMVSIVVPMAMLCFVQLVVGSFAQLLMIWGEEGRMFAWDASRFVLTCSALVISWKCGGSAEQAFWAFALAQIPCYATLVWMICRSTVARSSRHPVIVDRNRGTMP
jgi:O-antigen/teichoic acid export membrane protein